MEDAAAIDEALRGRREAAEALLERLVNQRSGSRDREGVARAVAMLAAELEAIGLAVEVLEERGLPRHLTARLGGDGAGGPRLLLIGHCDTVFPKSDRRRLTLEGDRFRGPGCADMKGGLVVALEALRAAGGRLRELGARVEVVINGDEELGSPSSRGLIEERARGADAALVFENCEAEDAVILGRQGIGRARVAFTGRAAHAGINPEDGRSAVLAMAEAIREISALDDRERGLGVVVGLARGGISRNTVPPSAEIEIDLRFRERAAGEEALRALERRAAGASVAGTEARFEGELHRPPMEADAPHQVAMLARVHEACRGLGLTEARPLRTGGGSDANLTAGLGVPSVDGLGVVGGAIHTVDEWCLRGSLRSRALLASVLLLRLAARSGA